MTVATDEEARIARHPRRHLGMLLVLVLSGLLLTVLFQKAGSVPHEEHYRYSLDVRGLREADTEINAEVMAVRLELNRNFDALTEQVKRADELIVRVGTIPGYLGQSDRDAVREATDNLGVLLKEKAHLVDRFKRDHAVLKNSLAYFPSAVNNYFGSPHSPWVGQSLGRYARHLLAFSRMPDTENKKLVTQSLAELKALNASAAERKIIDNLVKHGELISSRVQSVSSVSQQLLRLQTGRQLQYVEEMYRRGYARTEAGAERSRVVLYLLALGLTTYLAYTFIRLDRARRSIADANRELNERYSAQLLVEDRLRLHTTAFDNSNEGITLTNAEGQILEVNPAFTRITGYERTEVIGRNPRVLKSGRHDQAFYAAMWRSITETGSWRGEIWNRSKFGDIYPELLSISAVHDADGKLTNYVAVFSDISRLKEQEKQLVQMAYFDALTGLPNRVLLADRIVQAAGQSRRNGTLMAICYLDLDGFKPINDTWGHDVGDQLLVEVANRFKSALRAGDTVSRLGGDEFVLLMLDMADIAECERAVQRILHLVGEPLLVAPAPVTLSASIGVSIYPIDDGDADTLLRHADQAMYRAKQAGKNCYQVFDPDQDRYTRSQYDRVARIQDALSYKEIVLNYQPQVDMRTGRVIGVEALVRWQHPERGLLPPAEFLPMIEEHEVVVQLGDEVMEMALTQIELWLDQGLSLPVSVNVAGRQLQTHDFVQKISDGLGRHPRAAGLLSLELVESTALEDMVKVSRIIEECSRLGVSFSLDDFGTGYSSLTYLKRLPVKSIKIDQSFVGEILVDPNNLVIVQGVIGLSHAFRRQTIAEGVETVEQGRLLMQMECDYAQGYGIARAMPGADIPAWVKSWCPDPSWQAIADLRWDMADHPMLVAEVDLRNWVTQITHAVRSGQPVPHRHVGDPKYCRFSQWYGGREAHRYAKFPQFAVIDQEHARVHELAAEVDELMREGKVDAARGRLALLIEQQNKTLSVLTELQLQVAQPR